jgi:CCR4-NOT transcriptional regulation complex NOT5 subunit
VKIQNYFYRSKLDDMKKQEESDNKIETIPTLNANSRRTKPKDPFAKYDSYDPLSRFQSQSMFETLTIFTLVT